MIKKQEIIKVITIIVLFSFTYTFILHDTLYSISITIQEVDHTESIFKKIGKFVLPYKLGRVVEIYNGYKNNLVVLIQDLHCHPEVQNNIFEILSLFNNKYNLSKIYIEGAPKGKFSPLLLSTIPNEKLKKQFIDNLFDKGYLSAAEYFEILYNTGKMYGLENWEVYLDNYYRIKRLINNKQQNVEKIKKLESKIAKITDKYLSKEIKKFKKYIDNLDNKKLSEFKNLSKKLNISLEFYPEIKKYIELQDKAKQLKIKRLGYELREYFKDLQKILPYGVYSRLQQKLQNQKNIEEYYLYLLSVTEEYCKDFLNKRYPHLAKFFDYIKLNYNINPITLLQEEKILKQEILYRYAERFIDKDLLFLSFMTKGFESLIELKVTSEEYRYFIKNKLKYEKLLKKYLQENIDDILTILNDEDYYKFYEINVTRNKLLYDNLLKDIKLDQDKKDNKETCSNEIFGVNFSKIYIAIIGGFHSEIKEYLKQIGCSYLLITPNATKEYNVKIYEELVLRKVNFYNLVRQNFFSILFSECGIDPSVIIGLMIDSQKGKISINEIDKFLNDWINNIRKSEILDEKLKNSAVEFLKDIKILELNEEVTKNNRYYKIKIKKGDEIRDFIYNPSSNKIYEIDAKSQNNNVKPLKFSLLNRIFSGISLLFLPLIISIATTGNWLISSMSLFLLGLLFFPIISYFLHSYHLIKSRFSVKDGGEVIDVISNHPFVKVIESVDEWKYGKTVPAYFNKDERFIYIDESIMGCLPENLQKEIFVHELKHFALMDKYPKLKNRLLCEFLIFLSEIRNMFYGVLYPSRTNFLDIQIELLTQQLLTDYLTGIYNRRGLEKEFKQMIHSAIRSEKEIINISLLMIDIDNFKMINDIYGHHTGDEVLKLVAQIIEDNLRENDIFARVGGEEFILVLFEDEDNTIKVVERIRKKVSEEIARFLQNRKPLKGRKKIEDPISSKVGTVSIGLDSIVLDREILQNILPYSILESLKERAGKALNTAKIERNSVKKYDKYENNNLKDHNVGKKAKVKGVYTQIFTGDKFAKIIYGERDKSTTDIMLSKVDLNINSIRLQIENATRIESSYKKIILEILSLFERSPTVFYTFSELVEDLFGFVSKDNNGEKIIGLYEGLTDNFIFVFHEICEYLISEGAIKLELEVSFTNNILNNILNKLGFYKIFPGAKLFSGKLVIKDNNDKIIGEVNLCGEALSIAQKDPENLHYLLRAFQREVFKSLDIELTKIIQFLQSDLKSITLEREIKKIGLSRQHVDLISKHSKGIITIYELFNMVEDIKGGYGLGITIKDGMYTYEILCKSLGLITWDEVYEREGWKDKKPRTEIFMQKIVGDGKPIIFFLPRGIFVPYTGIISNRPPNSVTKEELEWLLNNPEKMKNVIFVVGAYEFIPPKIYRKFYNLGAVYSKNRIDKMVSLLKNYINKIKISSSERIRKTKNYSIIENAIIIGLFRGLLCFSWISNIGILNFIVSMVLGIWGLMLIHSSLAFLTKRFFVKDIKENEQDIKIMSMLNEEFIKRGTKEVRVTNFPWYKLAHVKNGKVFIANWLVAKSTHKIFNFLRILVLNIIIAHETARLKFNNTILTYLYDLLFVPLEIFRRLEYSSGEFLDEEISEEEKICLDLYMRYKNELISNLLNYKNEKKKNNYNEKGDLQNILEIIEDIIDLIVSARKQQIASYLLIDFIIDISDPEKEIIYYQVIYRIVRNKTLIDLFIKYLEEKNFHIGRICKRALEDIIKEMIIYNITHNAISVTAYSPELMDMLGEYLGNQKVINKEMRSQIESVIQEISVNEKIMEYFSSFPEIIKKLVILFKKYEKYNIYYPMRIDYELLEKIIQEREINKPDNRPLAVVIMCRYDHNDGFYLNGNLLRNLIDKGFRVMYYEVESVEEFIKSIKDATKEQKAKLLVINGHGSVDSIVFGEEIPNGILSLQNEEELTESIRDSLQEGGEILLNSCLLGKGRKKGDNLANMFRRVFPQARNNGIWSFTTEIIGGGMELTFDENYNITSLKGVKMAFDESRFDHNKENNFYILLSHLVSTLYKLRGSRSIIYRAYSFINNIIALSGSLALVFISSRYLFYYIGQFSIGILIFGYVFSSIYFIMLFISVLTKVFAPKEIVIDSEKEALVKQYFGSDVKVVIKDGKDLSRTIIARTEYYSKKVEIASWVLAKSDSIIFKFFRGLLLPIVLTHESLRLRNKGDLLTYILDVFLVPFNIFIYILNSVKKQKLNKFKTQSEISDDYFLQKYISAHLQIVSLPGRKNVATYFADKNIGLIINFLGSPSLDKIDERQVKFFHNNEFNGIEIKGLTTKENILTIKPLILHLSPENKSVLSDEEKWKSLSFPKFRMTKGLFHRRVVIEEEIFGYKHKIEIILPIEVEIKIDENNEIILNSKNKKIKFLSIKFLTNISPLTKLSIEDILNEEGIRFLHILKQKDFNLYKIFRNTLYVLQFLVYKEKFLAGSPHYLTYFGRDTALTALMLKPYLKHEIYKSAVQSIIDRLSSKGEVSHEEHLGKNDYKMIDEDFMLPILLREYLLDPKISDKDKKEFINKNKELILKNIRFVLNMARNNGLISLKEGAGSVGNWRDSAQGLAYSKYPFDVNGILVPRAVADIGEMIGEGFFELKDLGLNRIEEINNLVSKWRKIKEKFYLRFTKEEVERKIDEYLSKNKQLGEEEREYIEKMKQKIPQEGIRFYALALDSEERPIPVINSDVSFYLFFGNPTEEELVEILRQVIFDYPLGLFMPNVGILCANPIFADENLWYILDKYAYHGSVIWNWQIALIELGLIRQIELNIENENLVRLLYTALVKIRQQIDNAEKQISGLRNEELYSYRIENGSPLPTTYVGKTTEDTTSPARKIITSCTVQLWSAAEIAVIIGLEKISRLIKDKGIKILNDEEFNTFLNKYEKNKPQKLLDTPIRVEGSINGADIKEVIHEILRKEHLDEDLYKPESVLQPEIFKKKVLFTERILKEAVLRILFDYQNKTRPKENMPPKGIAIGIPNYDEVDTAVYVLRTAVIGCLLYYPKEPIYIITMGEESAGEEGKKVLTKLQQEAKNLRNIGIDVNFIILKRDTYSGKGAAVRLMMSIASALNVKSFTHLDADLWAMTETEKYQEDKEYKKQVLSNFDWVSFLTNKEYRLDTLSDEKRKEVINKLEQMQRDGEITGLSPYWIKVLLEPTLEKPSDKIYVTPKYVRNPFDGTITNFVIYPLALQGYRVNIRQPIGGDFAYSFGMLNILLSNKYEDLWFDKDFITFGFDNGVTWIAIAESAKIFEALLDEKLHNPSQRLKRQILLFSDEQKQKLLNFLKEKGIINDELYVLNKQLLQEMVKDGKLPIDHYLLFEEFEIDENGKLKIDENGNFIVLVDNLRIMFKQVLGLVLKMLEKNSENFFENIVVPIKELEAVGNEDVKNRLPNKLSDYNNDIQRISTLIHKFRNGYISIGREEYRRIFGEEIGEEIEKVYLSSSENPKENLKKFNFPKELYGKIFAKVIFKYLSNPTEENLNKLCILFEPLWRGFVAQFVLDMYRLGYRNECITEKFVNDAEDYFKDVSLEFLKELIRQRVEYLKDILTGKTEGDRKKSIAELIKLAQKYPDIVYSQLRYKFESLTEEEKNKILQQYRNILGDKIVKEFIIIAENLKKQGKKIVYFNATHYGGGVAEMYQSIVPLLYVLGVDVEWHILWVSNPEFYVTTKRIHNLIQGLPQPPPNWKIYEEINEENAHLFNELYKQENVVFYVDDPQPAYQISAIKKVNPKAKVIARLHIDTSGTKKGGVGIEVWEKLAEYWNQADIFLHQPTHTPKEGVKPLKVKQLDFPPAINPLIEKNTPCKLKEAKKKLSNVVDDMGRKVIFAKNKFMFVGRADPAKGQIPGLLAFIEFLKHNPDSVLWYIIQFATDDPEGYAQYIMLKLLLEDDPQLRQELKNDLKESLSKLGVEKEKIKEIVSILDESFEKIQKELPPQISLKDKVQIFTKDMSKTIPYFAALADAHMVLSTKEGYNLVISELAMHNLAVIATNLPVFQERIINGEQGGWLVSLLEDISSLGPEEFLKRYVRNEEIVINYIRDISDNLQIVSDDKNSAKKIAENLHKWVLEKGQILTNQTALLSLALISNEEIQNFDDIFEIKNYVFEIIKSVQNSSSLDKRIIFEIPPSLSEHDFRNLFEKIYSNLAAQLSSEERITKLEVKFHKEGTHKKVFKLTIFFENKEPINVSLAIKKEKSSKKGKEDITDIEIIDLKKLNNSETTKCYVPQFIYYPEIQSDISIPFYIEEFIKGPTAEELYNKGKLTQKMRKNIIVALLSIGMVLGGEVLQIPKDFNRSNFIFRNGKEEPVMVDIGNKRLNVLSKDAKGDAMFLAGVVALYGYRKWKKNDFIFNTICETLGEENGKKLLNNALNYIRENKTRLLKNKNDVMWLVRGIRDEISSLTEKEIYNIAYKFYKDLENSLAKYLGRESYILVYIINILKSILPNRLIVFSQSKLVKFLLGVIKNNWISKNLPLLSDKSVIVIVDGEEFNQTLQEVEIYKQLGLKVLVITSGVRLDKVEKELKDIYCEEKIESFKLQIGSVDKLKGVKMINIVRKESLVGWEVWDILLDLIDGDNGLIGKELNSKFKPAIVRMVGGTLKRIYYNSSNTVYKQKYNIIFNKLVYIGENDGDDILKISEKDINEKGVKKFLLKKVYPMYLRNINIVMDTLKLNSSQLIKIFRTQLAIPISLKVEQGQTINKKEMISILSEFNKTYIPRGVSTIILRDISSIKLEDLKEIIKSLRKTKLKGKEIKPKILIETTLDENEKIIKELVKVVDGIVILYNGEPVERLLSLKKDNENLDIIIKNYNNFRLNLSLFKNLGIPIIQVVDESFEISENVDRTNWYEINKPQTDTQKEKFFILASDLGELGVEAIILPQINTTIADLRSTVFVDYLPRIEEITSFLLNYSKTTTESLYIKGYHLGKSIVSCIDTREKMRLIRELLSLDNLMSFIGKMYICLYNQNFPDNFINNSLLEEIEYLRENFPLVVEKLLHLKELLANGDETKSIFVLAEFCGIIEGLMEESLLALYGEKYKNIIFEKDFRYKRLLVRILLNLHQYIRIENGSVFINYNKFGSLVEQLVVMNMLTKFYPGLRNDFLNTIERQIFNEENMSYEEKLLLVGIIGENNIETYKQKAMEILNSIDKKIIRNNIKLKTLYYYASVMLGQEPEVEISDEEITLYGIKEDSNTANIWLLLVLSKAQNEIFKNKYSAEEAIKRIKMSTFFIFKKLEEKFILSEKVDLNSYDFIKETNLNDMKTFADSLFILDIIFNLEMLPSIKEKIPTTIRVETLKSILSAV